MIKKEPLVSIVIPFYSGRNWLMEALESCFCQTYANYEVILLNDGSAENIDDILSLYKDRVTYYYHDNMGAAATRNKGILCSNGQYIAFLDSDDLWQHEKLEKQMNLILENNYMWCHCSYELFDNKTNKIIKAVGSGNLKGNCYPKFNYVCTVATPTVVIKKEALIHNKYFFNENLKFGEDICLWILLASKYPLCGISEPLVRVRLHGNNAAKDINAQIIQRGSFLKEFAIPNGIQLSGIGKSTYQYCSWLKKMCSRKNLPQWLKYGLFFPAWGIFKVLSKIN